MDISGNVAVVTGGASGAGRALALGLADRGAAGVVVAGAPSRLILPGGSHWRQAASERVLGWGGWPRLADKQIAEICTPATAQRYAAVGVQIGSARVC